MSRSRASLIIAVLAGGLVAGAAMGVTAQAETPDPLAPASFTYELQPSWDEVFTDEETGAIVSSTSIGATDPRASGVLTLANAGGGVVDEDRTLTVSMHSVRLVNDAGTWTGTGVGLQVIEPDERTKKQRKRGKGQPPLIAVTDVTQLTGDGAYDGLALFLTNALVANHSQNWGIIVPVDTVPGVPELPAESPDETGPPAE